MRKRFAALLAVSAMLVLAMTGVAMADATLTLSASPATVTYPHSSVLTVAFPTAEPTTAVIFAMPAGASVWTTVSPSVASTVSVKPRVTTAYKAVWNGLESAPVTVTVKAKLSKPILSSVIRHGRSVTVKGTMSPTEAGASVSLQFFRLQTTYKYLGKGRYKKLTTWDTYGDQVNVSLKTKNSSLATWSTKWKTSDVGRYKVVVSHEDPGHAFSSASQYFRVR